MVSMTPIRIRGKKTATAAEKWNAGKKRKVVEYSTLSRRSASVASGSSATDSPTRRKRKRIESVSRLEQLPSEILQAIFVFSTNPDLPIASPRLASQLDSHHLRHEITTRVLEAVIGGSGAGMELANATRLMNSKFFTWSFLTAWLDAEAQIRDIPGPRFAQNIWLQLRPHTQLLPPKKVLTGPFTEENVLLLELFTMTGAFSSETTDSIFPLYRELARRGADEAVADGSTKALSKLFAFGVTPDTELLRLAVIDEGCDQKIVTCILRRATMDGNKCYDVDLLDASIWSWAERARADGNEKGPWLISQLKERNRARRLVDCNLGKAAHE